MNEKMREVLKEVEQELENDCETLERMRNDFKEGGYQIYFFDTGMVPTERTIVNTVAIKVHYPELQVTRSDGRFVILIRIPDGKLGTMERANTLLETYKDAMRFILEKLRSSIHLQYGQATGEDYEDYVPVMHCMTNLLTMLENANTWFLIGEDEVAEERAHIAKKQKLKILPGTTDPIERIHELLYYIYLQQDNEGRKLIYKEN